MFLLKYSKSASRELLFPNSSVGLLWRGSMSEGEKGFSQCIPLPTPLWPLGGMCGEPLKTWASPARGEQPPSSSWPPVLSQALSSWALQVPSSAREWDTLPLQCVPPKMGDLQEVFTLREDWETGGHQKGKRSWGEGQDCRALLQDPLLLCHSAT